MNKDGADSKRMYCPGCRHYRITWEPHHPYACRAHGFKTGINPSVAVYQASGIHCQLFSPKKQSAADTVHKQYQG